MIKKLIPFALLALAALKLGGAEARGANVPYTMWDYAIVGVLLIITVVYLLFVKDGHPKAEWMSQNWQRDFADQNNAVRNQRRR